MQLGWEFSVILLAYYCFKGLHQLGGNRKGGKRSKSLRSSAIPQPKDAEKSSVFIAYSLNKRNRWLLPESLKQEIQNQKHGQVQLKQIISEEKVHKFFIR